MRPALEPEPFGAVADEAKACVDSARAKLPEREEDVLGAFHVDHASRPADDELIRADAQRAPALRAMAVVQRDALRELDPEPDDGEAVAGSDAERDEVVPDLRADRDQLRRRAREQTLEQAEARAADRIEVAAEHVPVERVDDDRRPRGSREQRSESADRSGLGGVRVQDVRPRLADQLHEAGDRPCVAQQRDLALKLRQPHDRDAVRVGDEHHRVLAALHVAGDERRVVAALGEPAEDRRRGATGRRR